MSTTAAVTNTRVLWAICSAPIARKRNMNFLKPLRQPAYVIPTLTFPLIFYVMFRDCLWREASCGRREHGDLPSGNILAFGVIGASLILSFAVGVAMERGYGWLQGKARQSHALRWRIWRR